MLSFFMTVLFAFFLTGLGHAEPIPVVVTLPVLQDFVEQVGGRHVSVKALMTGLESEHTYTPKPTDVIAVRNARLFVEVGLGLEVWVRALIKNADRSDLSVITTSEGVPLMMETGHPPHSEAAPLAGAHPESRGNPHIWLDPENAKTMIKQITQGLVRIDPTHREEYLRNQMNYFAELDKMVRDLKIRIAPLKSRRIITHHPAWPYFARQFGFMVRGDILSQVGAEPSAKQIGALIKIIRHEKIRVVVSEPQLNPKVPQMLAEETGIRVVTLSPLTGAIPGTDRYLDLIRYNVETLVAALGPH